jgi:transposase
MPSKYDENTKAKAVRLVREHADDYDSEWAAMCAISARLGMTAETLRKWVRQAEVDAGEAAGVPTETARELRELRRKNRELKQTTTYLSVEPESWVPPAPPWFLGLVKNVRRNLPICTPSPLTSTAESTASRLT